MSSVVRRHGLLAEIPPAGKMVNGFYYAEDEGKIYESIRGPVLASYIWTERKRTLDQNEIPGRKAGLLADRPEASSMVGWIYRATDEGKDYESFGSVWAESTGDSGGGDGGGGGGSVTVENNLSSTSISNALSANMGKTLKDMVDGINTILASDDLDYDTVQELVDAIKSNQTALAAIHSHTHANLAILNAITEAFTTALKNKLDGIEDNATADLTGAEIRDLLDALFGNTDWRTGGAGVNVVDSLTSTSTNDALAANAGKTLKDLIDALTGTVSGKADTSHGHTEATTGAAGFMSAADKSKLDGLGPITVQDNHTGNTVDASAGRLIKKTLSADFAPVLSNFVAGETYGMILIAGGAERTVTVPTGNIAASSTFTIADGKRRFITVFYDGTDYDWTVGEEKGAV